MTTTCTLSVRGRNAALTLAALLAGAAVAAAQPPDPIRYVVRFPAPQTHYLEIEATVPTAGQPDVELMMAVWTPGSYLVREFSRHVEAFTALDPGGRALAVDKTQKNRWRVTTRGADPVTVRYRVYAREMSVRTDWVDDRFALVNGAPTFVTLADLRPRPHDVRLVLPPDWARTMTALPPAPDGQPHHYRAPDFDTLVDSPIVAGNPAVYEFEVDGKPHYLVNVGEAGVWNGARAATDLERIVGAARDLWGSLPYDRYLFFNLITESGGGLEHLDSAVLMTNRWSTSTDAAYRGWLALASHEHFHAWNVKRLRPAALGPFDYERENYTRSLWVVEGLTEYYADVLLRRARLTSEAEFLQALSSNIRSVQSAPGRLVQPVDMASFDAWIKYYRPDENSSNSTISYYSKGAVLGFLLDARIRRATGGARSLDDVMRLAYQRYAGARGYTPPEFEALVAEVAGPGAQVDEWYATAVKSATELDYDEALDWFGLRLRRFRRSTRPWLGLNTRVDEGRLIVTQVRRGGPAERGGINVEDEILAIDDFRVGATELPDRLTQYRPGTTVSVLVARREELRRFEVTLDVVPEDVGSLEIDPGATPEQTRHRDAWLARD